MSEENVEIVRRFYEAGQRSIDAYWENPRSGAAALEAGDLAPETQAVLVFLHPEVEYNAVPAALEGGTAHGHLGWLRSWDAFLGASEEFSGTLNEVVDLGGGEVFVEGEITAKWKGSGMTLTEPRFMVLTLRDGLIARVNVYRDRDEALEAAGLSE
jgi:ketosteroid isomerase-like protein